MGDNSDTTTAPSPAKIAAQEDALLKQFFAEVSEVERDNEVNRILSCFKLNPFDYLNLSFDSSMDEVKRQYRKLSLLVHPDKCKHPQAKEAFGALAKAQQLLLDPQERDYILNQVNAAKEELRAKWKKQLKKDTASKLKSLVTEGKFDQEHEQSEEFQHKLKLKVKEILTDQEWRRRKMAMRISEEEGRLKKDEEETKELWKRKREHEEQWEGTREKRVSMLRLLVKGGGILSILPQSRVTNMIIVLNLRSLEHDSCVEPNLHDDMELYSVQLERFHEGRKEGKTVITLYCKHYTFPIPCEDYEGNVYRLKKTLVNKFSVLLQVKKGEIRPPKLKTEDPNKSYVQRPVKRG
ncbi:hypothetical protein MTR67_049644 [Solanum verrucosum]|uniref:J domain-containing protein n=1 Tax=Solanum verrucosum TaxID=315347 RepID=A0AAF0V2W5_SOLVR|nr:hypothetical protein MTR67_049644 [Solanum verrucosum]